MKIRIMTFHTPKNYGAILQAYALQTYINSLCDDVKIIDYKTPELINKYPLLLKPTTLKELVLTIIALFQLPKKIAKHNGFEKFIQKHINLTKNYSSTQSLYDNPPKADILITGSDQVFNPNRIIEERKAYYLDFADSNSKIASYAASFGVETIPESKCDEIAQYLNKFDYISVREAYGIDVIKKLVNKDVTEVLDPVFLINESMWNSILEHYNGIPDQYLLYYRLLDNKNADEAVKLMSDKLNLPIVVITDKIINNVKTKYVLRDANPSQFLWLFANAAFIASSSFHGVAFSIIYKKPFMACYNNDRFKLRTENLLNNLQLQNRFFDNNIDSLSSPINYNNTFAILNDLINKSKSYIDLLIN